MKRTILAALAALFLVSCTGGPNPARIRAERANYHFAVMCANGWFGGLPFTADDERLVRAALADWDASLQAEERLLGWPVGAVAADGGGK